MKHETKLFVRQFVKEIRGNNAAIFAGAGLSAPSGFVQWNELLQPIAEELNIKIESTSDLVAIAQYFANSNAGNRHRINQIILDEIGQDASPNENHRILADLPIDTYWTINYDKMIEKSLDLNNKIVDVKYTNEQLAMTKTKRDVIVYKMHGDVDTPDKAIILRDDYESYHIKMEPFTTALSGDLVEKTFLFIGISFNDPNLNYVLSRVRSRFSSHGRQHYCFIRNYKRKNGESDSEYENSKTLHRLFSEDLKRFNIKPILIDDYTEITEALNSIHRIIKTKNVFVSGSISDYGKFQQTSVELFIKKLVNILIKNESKIVTGFGLGIGNFVVTSALEEVLTNKKSRIEDFLLMRPFPFINSGDKSDQEVQSIWQKYRQEMLSHAGIAIFLFGNKFQDGHTVNASGMMKEYEIALKLGVFPIPIGGTSWISEEIYKGLCENLESVWGEIPRDIQEAFNLIGNEVDDLEKFLEPVVKIINFARRET